MKKYFYILSIICLCGCYEDDSRTLLSEDASHSTSDLSIYIKSISSHDAAFDDKIDNSSCFSLEFPYQLQVNSELKTISSIIDISQINEDDTIEIVYPVNTNFYNYEEHQALNQTDFNLIKNTCVENFNIVSNTCLDFQFPITIKEFNDLTESFETFRLHDDKEVYLHFENLHDNDVYEIDYPIFLRNQNSEIIRINSNKDFEELFSLSLESCN